MKKAITFLLRNIPADLHAAMKSAAKRLGMSIREFIMQAIREKLARL
jgi:predicted HicB family RNase H-like nuclease